MTIANRIQSLNIVYCLENYQVGHIEQNLGSLEKHPHFHLLLIENSTHSLFLRQYCRCHHSSYVHIHTHMLISMHTSDIRHANEISGGN